MKILSIFGTRPEAIKMAPVIKALERRAETIESRICVTAQHRDMLDQVLSIFRLEPDYDLQIMRDRQSLSYLTAGILTELENILSQVQPDYILVHGDTTTTMTAALAGFYHRIPVGHVEAGLRTHDRYNPFPEEINRRMTDTVSDLHFAPTSNARENLLSEGIEDDSIYVTGNTVIDALQEIVKHEGPKSRESIDNVVRSDRKIILVTVHRRENLGMPIEDIFHALVELANQYKSSVQIIYPVHLNPVVRQKANDMLSAIGNISLIPPLEYFSFVHLMLRSYLILTDSGGIQEEAPSLGKPVLVLREKTERPEGVAAGVLKVVGTDRKRIVQETARLLDNPTAYKKMAKAANPYGDGQAGERIVEILIQHALSLSRFS
ncbi:MAG: UDP-N-acetylglucosamine 2-epimerase (non-hydrolyzing) [Gemmatimonadota bacterium]|nr:UDP-N-acetylglucosamine 2-epimerase (non-hydrolyzing) [Gemmatimonadota bacterium]